MNSKKLFIFIPQQKFKNTKIADNLNRVMQKRYFLVDLSSIAIRPIRKLEQLLSAQDTMNICIYVNHQVVDDAPENTIIYMNRYFCTLPSDLVIVRLIRIHVVGFFAEGKNIRK